MKQSTKTLLLWVALIIGFVAFYNIFANDPSRPPAPRDPDAPSVWTSILTTWLPVVFLFLFFIFFMRRMRNQHAPTHDGVRLLYQGRYVQALQKFEEYRRAQPQQPAGPFNTGSTKMQLWKLESALLDLQASEKLANGKVPTMAAMIPEHLALTLALLGREGEARLQLAAIPAGQGDPGRVALVEGILLARRGDAAGARAKLNTFEVKQMAGTVGGLARALDAFCIEQLNGELRHVDRIALFGETGPDELRRAWPEFIAFVERAPAW